MKIVENTPLAGYTSLHAGGPARRLVILEENDQLTEVLKSTTEKPVYVLGSGTNCLVSDAGLPGTVIVNKVGVIQTLPNNQVKADSGVNWDELVQTAINAGLWGLECMSGIPGNIGAALAGNIAAYGQSVADVLLEAELFNLADQTIFTWKKDQFGFDYRSSVLQKPENQELIVLSATFQLSTGPTIELAYASALNAAQELGLEPNSLQNRRQIIMASREKASALLHDVSVGPFTAGSFFKNPLVSPEQIDGIVAHEEFGLNREQITHQNEIHGNDPVRISAAHVLLAAGFSRGQTWGAVRLHPDHILKLENTGQATAQEIYAVVQEILQTVQEKLHISLEPEVRFLGTFN